MTDLDSSCTCVYQVDCSVCPPGYGGFCMLADVSGFSLGQEVRIDSLLVSESVNLPGQVALLKS